MGDTAARRDPPLSPSSSSDDDPLSFPASSSGDNAPLIFRSSRRRYFPGTGAVVSLLVNATTPNDEGRPADTGVFKVFELYDPPWLSPGGSYASSSSTCACRQSTPSSR